jgi:hypothetical protein
LVEQAGGPYRTRQRGQREFYIVAPPLIGGVDVSSSCRTRACRRAQRGCAPQTAHHHFEKGRIVPCCRALAELRASATPIKAKPQSPAEDCGFLYLLSTGLPA